MKTRWYLLVQMATSPRSRRVPNRHLTRLRVNHGMATTDLAYRAGTSAKTIRLAEAGFVPGPRIQFAIAQVFVDADTGRRLVPTDIWPLEMQQHVGRRTVVAA